MRDDDGTVDELGSIAEFERERLRERTLAGLRRARAQGTRLGRRPVRVTADDLARVATLPIRTAAKVLGIAPGTLVKARRVYQQSGAPDGAKPLENAATADTAGVSQQPVLLRTRAGAVHTPCIGHAATASVARAIVGYFRF